MSSDSSDAKFAGGPETPGIDGKVYVGVTPEEVGLFGVADPDDSWISSVLIGTARWRLQHCYCGAPYIQRWFPASDGDLGSWAISHCGSDACASAERALLSVGAAVALQEASVDVLLRQHFIAVEEAQFLLRLMQADVKRDAAAKSLLRTSLEIVRRFAPEHYVEPAE